MKIDENWVVMRNIEAITRKLRYEVGDYVKTIIRIHKISPENNDLCGRHPNKPRHSRLGDAEHIRIVVEHWVEAMILAQCACESGRLEELRHYLDHIKGVPIRIKQAAYKDAEINCKRIQGELE